MGHGYATVNTCARWEAAFRTVRMADLFKRPAEVGLA